METVVVMALVVMATSLVVAALLIAFVATATTIAGVLVAYFEFMYALPSLASRFIRWLLRKPRPDHHHPSGIDFLISYGFKAE